MRHKKLFIYLVAGFFIITSAFVVQFIYPHRAESPALNETDTEVSPALQFEESYQEDGNREVERESARSDGEQEEIRASSAKRFVLAKRFDFTKKAIMTKVLCLFHLTGECLWMTQA
jgi:hypothetical protein